MVLHLQILFYTVHLFIYQDIIISVFKNNKYWLIIIFENAQSLLMWFYWTTNKSNVRFSVLGHILYASLQTHRKDK